MDSFEVQIKIVDRLPQGDCGICTVRSRSGNKHEILISRRAHKTVAEFGSTLLHELLHLWVNLLKIYGYRVRLKYEHMWIRAVEKVIIEFMYILKLGESDKIRGDKSGR